MARGGFFQRSSLGRGIRDFGVATVNTPVSAIEGAFGADFGVDEALGGYKTGFGRSYGGATEALGSAAGAIGAQTLNTFVPGASVALQFAGEGLENAGAAREQSTAGLAGSAAANLFAYTNPKVMQNISGMFTSPPDPSLDQTKVASGKKGAKVEGDIEAESGEIILAKKGATSLNSKAPLKIIGDNAAMIMGNEKHSKGGVDLSMGEGDSMIMSDFLKTDSGNTYSEEAQKLIKQIEALKKNLNSNDFITRETAELEIKSKERELDSLIQEQQSKNNNSTAMAKRGLWANIHAKRKRGERMRKKGEKGAPTEAQMARARAQMGMSFPQGVSSSMYGLGFQMPLMGPSSIPNYGGGNVMFQTPMMDQGQFPSGVRSFDVPTARRMGVPYSRSLQNGGLAVSPDFLPTLQPQPMPGFIPGSPLTNFQMNNPNPQRYNNIQQNKKFERTDPQEYAQSNINTGTGRFGNIAPFAAPLYNIGVGLSGLLGGVDQIDASKYMQDADVPRTTLNRPAMSAPLRQSFATFMNAESDPRRRQAAFAAYAPKIAQTEAQTDYMQGRLDTSRDLQMARINALNNRMLFGVDDLNRQLQAAPYQFLGQGVSDLTKLGAQLESNQMLRNILNI
tara:strand:- start:530 stop:2392 length:1863 start_codon:yes stop_codon:yes gene_type:complete